MTVRNRELVPGRCSLVREKSDDQRTKRDGWFRVTS